MFRGTRTPASPQKESPAQNKLFFILRLRYVDMVINIDARGQHFQHLLKVHSDFPNADLQEVLANKIKRVQACIDARGQHFQHLL
jgi:hypothetical protein